MVPNTDLGIDDNMSEDAGMIADRDVIADHDIRPDRRMGADPCRGRDHRSGVNTLGGYTRRIKQLQHLGEGQVRVGCE